MKRLVLGIVFFTTILSLSGCGGLTYNIYNKPIKDNSYATKNNIRVIGVFNDTLENKKKIDKSIEQSLLSYKNINNLKCKNVYDYKYTKSQATNKCEVLLRGGYYGYYRNAYEKEKLFNICWDKIGREKINKNYCEGSKIKVNPAKKKILFAKAIDGELRSITVYIKTKKIDNKIIVYLKNRPRYPDIVNYFLFLNNKIIKEFNKNGLHNIMTKYIKFEE